MGYLLAAVFLCVMLSLLLKVWREEKVVAEPEVVASEDVAREVDEPCHWCSMSGMSGMSGGGDI
jgi:hypothetical protein